MGPLPKSRSLSLAFVSLFLLSMTEALFGQMGQMTGRVEDASGAVVVGKERS